MGMRPLYLVIKDGEVVGWTYHSPLQLPRYELRRCDKKATENLPQLKLMEDWISVNPN